MRVAIVVGLSQVALASTAELAVGEGVAAQSNPSYANSFSESSWPQNPAIHYPGYGTGSVGVSPYDPQPSFLAVSSVAPVYPSSAGTYPPVGGSLSKPWSASGAMVFPSATSTPLTASASAGTTFAPISAAGYGAYAPYPATTSYPPTKLSPPVSAVGQAVITSGVTTSVSPVPPSLFGPVQTSSYGSFVPYGGNTPWPFNKPWPAVAPSGQVAVLTTGATGPITTITPAPIGQVQFGQTTLSPKPAVYTSTTGTPNVFASVGTPNYSTLSTATTYPPFATSTPYPSFGTTTAVPFVASGLPVGSVSSFGSLSAPAASFGLSQAFPSSQVQGMSFAAPVVVAPLASGR